MKRFLGQLKFVTNFENHTFFLILAWSYPINFPIVVLSIFLRDFFKNIFQCHSRKNSGADLQLCLEWNVGSVDCDCDRSNHIDGVGKSTFVTRWNIFTVRKSSADIRSIENTFAVGRSVWIAGLSINTRVVVDVGETLTQKIRRF